MQFEYFSILDQYSKTSLSRQAQGKALPSYQG